MSYNYIQPYLGLSNGIQTQNAAGGGAVGGWVELGRTTLGSAGDSINVSSLADKRYYMILGDLQGTGAIDANFQFNSDTGSTYANRRSTNGGSDSTGTSQTNIDLSASLTSGSKVFQNAYIANKSSNEKLVIANNVTAYATGAGTAPIRDEVVGKWANTSNAISSIQLTNTKAGSFDTGSEVVVLGRDPADDHTTNFWEELASVDLSGGAADQISSGTFTNKKYLWVQAYLEGSGAINNRITWNNVTTSTYAFRYSADGGTDVTGTTQANIQPNTTTTSMFMNFFIVNNGSNEPLLTGHSCEQSTAGAGNAPSRSEFVGKSSGTTALTEIDIDNSLGGSYGTNTIMKVWGSD